MNTLDWLMLAIGTSRYNDAFDLSRIHQHGDMTIATDGFRMHIVHDGNLYDTLPDHLRGERQPKRLFDFINDIRRGSWSSQQLIDTHQSLWLKANQQWIMSAVRPLPDARIYVNSAYWQDANAINPDADNVLFQWTHTPIVALQPSENCEVLIAGYNPNVADSFHPATPRQTDLWHRYTVAADYGDAVEPDNDTEPPADYIRAQNLRNRIQHMLIKSMKMKEVSI